MCYVKKGKKSYMDVRIILYSLYKKTMPRVKTKMVPYKKSLNAWQNYIKNNHDKVRSLPNKQRFRASSKMYKIDTQD